MLLSLFVRRFLETPPEAICATTPHPTKPDAALGLCGLFDQAILGFSSIAFHLEGFGLDVDGHVCAIVFVLKLGTDHPIEYFLPALGEF